MKTWTHLIIYIVILKLQSAEPTIDAVSITVDDIVWVFSE